MESCATECWRPFIFTPPQRYRLCKQEKFHLSAEEPYRQAESDKLQLLMKAFLCGF